MALKKLFSLTKPSTRVIKNKAGGYKKRITVKPHTNKINRKK